MPPEQLPWHALTAPERRLVWPVDEAQPPAFVGACVETVVSAGCQQVNRDRPWEETPAFGLVLSAVGCSLYRKHFVPIGGTLRSASNREILHEPAFALLAAMQACAHAVALSAIATVCLSAEQPLQWQLVVVWPPTSESCVVSVFVHVGAADTASTPMSKSRTTFIMCSSFPMYSAFPC